jgi:1,2-phenylacetyl-CoA epoxidase catalytic subunit
MTQNGEVKAEEFEVKKRQYEEVKSRWIAEMNERVKASGRDNVIDWKIYWPFRYPQPGF